MFFGRMKNASIMKEIFHFYVTGIKKGNRKDDYRGKWLPMRQTRKEKSNPNSDIGGKWLLLTKKEKDSQKT